MGRECRLVWPQGLGAGPGCPRCQPPVPTTHIVASRAISLLCLPHEPLWGRPCGVRCLASAVPSPTWDPHPAVRWGPSRWGLCPPSLLEGHPVRTARGGAEAEGWARGWAGAVTSEGRGLHEPWLPCGHSTTRLDLSTQGARDATLGAGAGWGLTCGHGGGGEEGQQGSAQRCDLRMP